MRCVIVMVNHSFGGCFLCYPIRILYVIVAVNYRLTVERFARLVYASCRAVRQPLLYPA
jgi:hypothetical protein